MKRYITLIILMSAGSAWAHPGHAHGQEMAGLKAAAGAICMSMALMSLGWLAGRNARLQKLAPALVALAGAGMLAIA
jgi:hypothetical protein